MKIIADLHLHSKYSRAVSQEMVLPKMAEWGRKKGINLLGTGDFTHPLWFREIKANLQQISEGIYELAGPAASLVPSDVLANAAGARRDALRSRHPQFILSTEISSIYSQGGKLRRIHQVVLAPSIQTVEKINQELERRGCNLHSDGRPIIGIPAKDLVKIILEIDAKALVIPAHAWTPWFSLYGSQSGFDSLEECYGEMSQYIYAVETGLSSDPAMNWRIAELNQRSILSNSDAHSGPKLGREATVFELEKLNFESVRQTISQISPMGQISKNRIAYTLEFYPEEGKYHYSGHRACGIKQTPEETLKLGEICPVCGKKMTIGVMHRVDQLADSTLNFENRTKNDENGVRWISSKEQPNRPPYAMLVPLQEIIAEALGTAPASLKVQNEYEKLVSAEGGPAFGWGEFGVLLKTPITEIVKIAGEKIGEGVRRVRGGEIFVDPGYDGVFGTVKIWGEKEEMEKKEEEQKEQMSLF